ncbi:hypothetical protein GCM10028774_36120 [Spirosoma jeollabukense]
MGQDKSQLVYHQKPQREHLTDLLRPYCDTVYWSMNAAQEPDVLSGSQPVIVDAYDWPGPLNGILSAFQQHPETAWLVVACDMPLLSARSLNALVEGRDPAKVATAFFDSDSRFPEPLLCIWEAASKPIMEKAIAIGQWSPRKFLMMNDTHLLTAPDIGELLNVNDPAALAALKQRS